MIAFSFSRMTFIGLIVALVLTLLFAFFGGWLVGVSHAPAPAGQTATDPGKASDPAGPPVPSGTQSAGTAAPAPGATDAAATSGNAAASGKPASENGRPAPAGQPAGQPARTRAPATASPAPSRSAAAPPASGAPPAEPKPAEDQAQGGAASGPIPPAAYTPPPSPLAQAMARPLERFGISPPPARAGAPADEKPGGPPLSLLPEQRDAPRELNAQLGRLENAEPVYSVEVGSFSGDESADRLYARLEGRLYDVYRVRAEPPMVPQTVVSVRVGAFDQRALADAAALELRNREGLDARVVRVDPARLNDLLKAVKKQTP